MVASATGRLASQPAGSEVMSAWDPAMGLEVAGVVAAMDPEEDGLQASRNRPKRSVRATAGIPVVARTCPSRSFIVLSTALPSVLSIDGIGSADPG
jgi:hypothetical protein